MCHDFINTIIPYYIFTIHIYLWYDLIRSTLCVCVEFTKKIIWEKRCQGILFVEGVKFSSFDEMYTVFHERILFPMLQKNNWGKYTVREVGFSTYVYNPLQSSWLTTRNKFKIKKTTLSVDFEVQRETFHTWKWRDTYNCVCWRCCKEGWQRKLRRLPWTRAS